MTEFLYGLADIGGTQLRTAVWNGEMWEVGAIDAEVDPNDYEGTVQAVGDNMLQIAEANGGLLVATSVSIASELNDAGHMMLGGALSSWDGKQIGVDIGQAVGLPAERSGALNDMKAVAVSQIDVNKQRGVREDGYATTLSSGWGGKPYSSDGAGWVGYDSPGHKHLRAGAKCPCGEDGHAEAFVSGRGVELNHGVQMKDWLTDRDAAGQFVTDVATNVVAIIENQRTVQVPIDVMRWMGGVASNQPILMNRAEQEVREQLGSRAPIWGSVSMGNKAGLHGAFVDARQRAAAA